MIKIICIGKIKESYLKEAIDDYCRRLSKYIKVKIIELKEENIGDKDKILMKERNEIIKKIDKDDYIITLDKDGQMLNSIQLSNRINNLLTEGKSNIVFIIGSSYGVSDDIKKISNLLLSFSLLTFPHQLFRLILLEQLYRGFKIINNEAYHK